MKLVHYDSWLALARAAEATDGPAAAANLLDKAAAQATDPDASAVLTFHAEQLHEAALPPEAKAARAMLDAALSAISKAASDAGAPAAMSPSPRPERVFSADID